MHLEVFLEEDSAEFALRILLPKILGDRIGCEIYSFQGKHDLLTQLPNRFKAYKNWLPDDWKLVVLLDEDREDCLNLKRRLECIAHDAGLLTWTKAGHDPTCFQVLNRIAIEELEAWFFGDVAALHAAYPRVSRHLAERQAYRDPDAISGGTWESLERVLQQAGYYAGGLPKREVARKVSIHMDPDRNRSRSFQTFKAALRAITAKREG